MRSRVILGASLALALSGCVNLQAVESVSGRLITASQGWNAVATELPASCQRLWQFNTALENCNEEKAASEGLVAANTILTAYFKALRDSASDKTFTVKEGLDALSGSVGKIPGIEADKVEAASGLASLLVRLATDGAREHTLRQLILEGGPRARNVVALLRETVPARLTSSLDAERLQTTATFAILLQGHGVTIPIPLESGCDPAPRISVFPGQSFLVANDYCDRLRTISARKTAVANYSEALTSADAALSELMSNETRLDAPALIQRLGEIEDDLTTQIDAVQKAFD